MIVVLCVATSFLLRIYSSILFEISAASADIFDDCSAFSRSASALDFTWTISSSISTVRPAFCALVTTSDTASAEAIIGVNTGIV